MTLEHGDKFLIRSIRNPNNVNYFFVKDEEKFEKIFPNEKSFVECEEKLELLLVLEKKVEGANQKSQKKI